MRRFMGSLFRKRTAFFIVSIAGIFVLAAAAFFSVRQNAEDTVWAALSEELSVPSSSEPAAEEKIVYLTFDDGPSPLTPRILDILKNYQIRATFFVTGINPECAQYIRAAYDAGHVIGMHTYSHDYKEIYSSAEAYYEDLAKISQLCMEQIGYVPKYIRFPGGSSNSVSLQYSPGLMTLLTREVTDKGYRYFDWNAVCGDGEGSFTVEELVENATDTAGKNRIVLLCHDGRGKDTTADALPQIIEYYRSHGYSFKTVSDFSETMHHRVKN